MSKGLAFLKSAAVALALVGIVFPQTKILADQKAPAKPTVKVMAANSVLDIRLSSDGTFSGRAVTHAGTPVQGATVILKQGKTEVARSVTDRNGQFVASNVKQGVYQIKSGATEGVYRMWSEESAPPNAKPHGLLILDENGARGQYGVYDDGGALWVVSAIAVAGLGIGIAGLVVANDAKRAADNNQFHSP